jgi:hypothetical protein
MMDLRAEIKDGRMTKASILLKWVSERSWNKKEEKKDFLGVLTFFFA